VFGDAHIAISTLLRVSCVTVTCDVASDSGILHELSSHPFVMYTVACGVKSVSRKLSDDAKILTVKSDKWKWSK